jgi:SAM-dependent methyltransferase
VIKGAQICLIIHILEAIRVLRPGGLLYLSTTNRLCPMQNEFDLPLYSWYPRWLKRRYERLAVTTRPELVAYARYPAVHWFTPYGLARFLGKRGLRCFDRFDLIEATSLKKTVAQALRVQPFRLVGHMLTRASVLFAVKQALTDR